MKIKIKTFSGELPSYLTTGKVYQLDTTNDLSSGDVFSYYKPTTLVELKEM